MCSQCSVSEKIIKKSVRTCNYEENNNVVVGGNETRNFSAKRKCFKVLIDDLFKFQCNFKISFGEVDDTLHMDFKQCKKWGKFAVAIKT